MLRIEANLLNGVCICTIIIIIYYASAYVPNVYNRKVSKLTGLCLWSISIVATIATCEFCFPSWSFPLIIYSGKDEHIQHQQQTPDAYGDSQCGCIAAELSDWIQIHLWLLCLVITWCRNATHTHTCVCLRVYERRNVCVCVRVVCGTGC